MKQFMTKKMKNKRHEIIALPQVSRQSMSRMSQTERLPKTMDILIKLNIGTLVSDQ